MMGADIAEHSELLAPPSQRIRVFEVSSPLFGVQTLDIDVQPETGGYGPLVIDQQTIKETGHVGEVEDIGEHPEWNIIIFCLVMLNSPVTAFGAFDALTNSAQPCGMVKCLTEQ